MTVHQNINYVRPPPLKVLDLFSGIGGFSLGFERAGMKTIAFCEIEPFCQKVLNKHWPHVPIFNDVRSLEYDGSIDVICGGYPCQPFSVAGKRKGKEDDRYLWPSMFSLIKKHRPSWVIGENVAGHINLGLDDVLADLEDEGYASRAFVIPACAVGAPHRRDRVWIVACKEAMAYPASQQGSSRNYGGEQGSSCQSREVKFRGGCGGALRSSNWEAEPDVGRVALRVPHRVDRLRALGNAVVPQIAEIIGRAIMEVHNPIDASDLKFTTND